MAFFVDLSVQTHRVLPNFNWRDAYRPVNEWNRVAKTGRRAPCCTTRVINVPEGTLHRTSCNECGETLNWLHDQRYRQEDEDPRHADAIAKAFSAWPATVTSWIGEHDSCQDAPKQHSLPRPLKVVAERMRKAATWAVACDERVQHMLHLVPADQALVAICLDGVLQAEPEATRVATAARQAATREYIAQHGHRLVGAIEIRHAWTKVNRDDERMLEGILVTACTGAFSSHTLFPFRYKGVKREVAGRGVPIVPAIESFAEGVVVPGYVRGRLDHHVNWTEAQPTYCEG